MPLRYDSLTDEVVCSECGVIARGPRTCKACGTPFDHAVKELRAVIDASPLSVRAWAREVVFREPRTVQRWLSGASPIPNVVKKALRAGRFGPFTEPCGRCDGTGKTPERYDGAVFAYPCDDCDGTGEVEVS